MNTLKEIVIDVLLLFAAWFLITAGSIHRGAQGFTCGRQEASENSAPSRR